MKLICQGNELSDALAKVVKALPVKRNNPILDGVKLTALGDTLTIFATDLELAIEKKINAQVLIEGEIVVPGKLFADYAKKIEEEQVELDGTDPTKLIIKYLDSELMIKCFSADACVQRSRHTKFFHHFEERTQRHNFKGHLQRCR